jgi:hypothetical protein
MNFFIRFHQRQSASLLCLLLAFVVVLGACASPTPAPITLAPGNFTALGVNPKSDAPTPSNIADLQAAETGTLQLPALVEFYGDT